MLEIDWIGLGSIANTISEKTTRTGLRRIRTDDKSWRYD
jgi:hypothetical protein